MNRVVRSAAVLAAVLVSSAFGPAAAHAAGVATTWCGGANLAQTDRKPDLLSGNQIDVIYYDGPISDPNTCGQGGGYSNLYSSGPSWAVIYMQACGLNVGDANHAAHVVTHELLHSLGAVGPGAPHDCPSPDDGHVCDSMLDILYPFLSANSVFDSEVLDVNHDDYYGNGGQFDIRNSSWLQHLDVSSFALTVTTGGSGTGTVTSDVGPINCPGSCTASFDQGQVVKLTAHPDSGFRLDAWGGACSGRGDCTVTVSKVSSVTATFGPASHQLVLSVTGRGRVVSAPTGISCPGSCTSAFDADSVVALMAVPAKGYKFAGWSGACRGTSTCSVAISADTNVGAAFKKKKK